MRVSFGGGGNRERKRTTFRMRTRFFDVFNPKSSCEIIFQVGSRVHSPGPVALVSRPPRDTWTTINYCVIIWRRAVVRTQTFRTFGREPQVATIKYQYLDFDIALW